MDKLLSDKTLGIIAEVFAEYGEEFARLAKDNLRKEGDASGELYDSIRFEVEVMGDDISLEILMADYAQFVDEGRGPGKQPPPDAMRAWVRQKGIGRGEQDVERTAYVIGRSIGEKGTDGKNFIPEIKEKEIVKRLEDKLGDALTDDIREYILKGTSIFR